MNANGERLKPPDLSHYEENRRKFPLDELAKYTCKHIAFRPDGTRTVASGATEEELEAALPAAGIHFSAAVSTSWSRWLGSVMPCPSRAIVPCTMRTTSGTTRPGCAEASSTPAAAYPALAIISVCSSSP